MDRILSAVRGNIVAWLALFVALGGTSLAASHYLITSTKQIKPSVISAIRTSPLAADHSSVEKLEADVGVLESQLRALCSGIRSAEIETEDVSVSEPEWRAKLNSVLFQIYNSGCRPFSL